MKNTSSFKQALAVFLFVTSTASSADVWKPSNTDSNFFTQEVLFGLTSSDTFGLFEDTLDFNSVTASDAKLAFVGGTTVTFAQNGNDFSINTDAASGTLLGSSNFQLGWLSPSGWVTESSSKSLSLIGETVFALTFIDPSAPAGSGEHHLYVVDIEPSQATADHPAAVPLPPSALYMISAVLGFFYTGRRKKVQSFA